MYSELQKKLEERLRAVLRSQYQIEPEKIVIEQPPEVAFGEYALPLAFELARKLRKAPRKIAEEIVAALGSVEGFIAFEVAGAGYINARLDRGLAAHTVAAGGEVPAPEQPIHSLVEHTSINPNKAAHVGHLRNAILGDTFVRLLRAAGQKVDVQNYIDNTGVQVADVVVGLMHLEGLTLSSIEALMQRLAAEGRRIDYYCWDLYAKTSQWYEADPAQKEARRKLRLDTLHAIEHGGNETAEIAEIISTAVLRRHVETMLRLGIEYDLLPRESEILHLHFWDMAFEQLKDKGVLYFETEGKNKGCWVMTRPGAVRNSGTDRTGEPLREENAESSDASDGPDEDAKVIVRSNGTVTYVGKDIAYHLWKFGLLGRDFAYRRFFDYPNHTCWISAATGEPGHPHFGGAQAIYNVIDSRQSDPQANVIEALRGLGYTDQAAHYTHFSYEMVALTPRCALELGYEVSEEDRARPYIEVSGRKGFGVKADDLIDKLIAATRSEVDSRHPELATAEREAIAKAIAVGALRYFMLRYTRNTVIAFDFKDALSFEGETGPYLQYAVVRTRSIFRKAGITPDEALADAASIDAAPYLSGEGSEGIWEVWLRAAKTTLLLDQCIQTAEPAYLAKHAFQLAQDFSNFYRRHHILTEEDPARKKLLLATAAVTQRELIRSLSWLGIDAPEAM
ncbi:arginine--tRNA ligase [Paracidobacterium acidisoli]|uniref:arginine--tRNA ligase n=1 Tax=Paracidobacterium acidisoli TaxID=2303751 RepID=A0A372ISW0_9BACT|nr:arginine--tRNA ligase [Paracidobacterium acidisoli]